MIQGVSFSKYWNESAKTSFVILLFCVTIIIGFRNVIFEPMLAYSDMSPFPISIQQANEVIQSAWQPPSGAFWYSSIDLAVAVRIVFMILSFGNVSLAQKMFIMAPYILSFAGLYLVLRRYVKSRLAGFLAAFVYAVNPLTITVFLGGAMGWMYVNAILPFLFLLMLRLSEEKSTLNTIRDVCLFGILFAVAFSMGAQIVLFVFPFFVFVLFSSLQKRKKMNFIRVFSVIFVAFLVGVILCLPVFLPMGKELVNYTAPGQVSALDVEMNYKYENSVDPILSILSLQPTELSIFGWDINSAMVIISMIIPLLAFSAILTRKKWPGFVIFSLILAAGTIVFIYLGYLGVTVPLFRYFRFLEVLPVSNAPSLLLAFAYALLIGYVLDLWLAERGKPKKNLLLQIRGFGARSIGLGSRHLQAAACAFIFVVLLGINWPLFTGTMGLHTLRSQDTTEIPPEFYTISNWLNEKRVGDPNARSLWLPYSYNEIEIKIRYIDRQSVTVSRSLNRYVTTDFTMYSVASFQKVFIDGTSKSAGALLGPLSVKYVIVWLGSKQSGLPRFEYERSGVVGLVGSPVEFQKVLDSQKDFKLVVSSEKFLIYENTRQMPHLSIVKNGNDLRCDAGTSIDDFVYVTDLIGGLPENVRPDVPLLLNSSPSEDFSSEIQLVKNDKFNVEETGNYMIFFSSAAVPLVYIDGIAQESTGYENTYLSQVFLTAGAHNLTTIEKPRSMHPLALWWKLDEGSGTTATDYSSNSLHGVISGNFTWENGENRAVPVFQGKGSVKLDKMTEMINESYTIVMVAKFDQVGDNPLFSAEKLDPSKHVGVAAFGGKALLMMGEGDQELQLKSDTVLESDNLYQIAFGRDQQGQVFLAVDGRVEKTGVDISGVTNFEAINFAPGLSGKVYDFRIYTTILSEDDLEYLNRRTEVLKLKPKAIVLRSPDDGDGVVEAFSDLQPETISGAYYKHEAFLNPHGTAFIYLAEPFDSRWIAYYDNGTKLEHFVAYGGMNAFLAEGNDNERITVFFEEQKNRDNLIALWIGSWILVFTLVASTTGPISRLLKKSFIKVSSLKEIF